MRRTRPRRGESFASVPHLRTCRPGHFTVQLLEPRLHLAAQAYTWQNAAIGGGGFVDGIFFSPTQQNVIYARTDIGGLYKTTSGGTSWTQLLDFVGNNTSTSGNGTQSQEIGVLSFAIDPENPNNLYADVGEYSGTNGAVFYSTNAGASWSQTNLSFYVGGNSNGRGDGEQLAVDPNNSNIVFLGSNSAGLWESTNAGHSFSQIAGGSTGLTSTMSTTFVYIDPTSGNGTASQTIYLGIDSTASGSNLYESLNGGTTWAEITGTGSVPNTWLPGHAVKSNGYLYVGYANAEAPNGSLTAGGLFRYTPGTTVTNGVWANISPQTPGGNNATFGYDAVAADPENPNTIVVTSFDRYGSGDQIWRTTNANATTPTWVALYGSASSRNTSTAPWIAAFGDGIGNWSATVAIDPYNPAHIMYGTGQGLWSTTNGTSTSTLTAANSWTFPDTGIEFTSAIGIVAASSGTPLFSALGDINGFAHTTLTSSPAAGAILPGGNIGTMNDVDVAGQNPSDDVIVGSTGSHDGAYSTNDGASWTEFASDTSGSTTLSGGEVAMSANGSTILWETSGNTPSYSTNNGTTWTASTMPSGTLTGGTVIADRVNANYFYYWTENSNDNSWTLYISTNAGKTFTASTGGALGTGNAWLAASPYTAGTLYLSSYVGIYQSTNFGASFTHPGTYSISVNGGELAVGAPAPGSTTPALYVYATYNNFLGVYRSDDGGSTWTQLNDVNHQWGGLIQTMAADPNVFGRVYIGTNGRGIIVGNPTSSLPTNWSDSDINTPGNPGWATSSTTLSTGTVVSQWDVNGGGAGMTGTSDQFNFADESVTGNNAVIAELNSLDNPGTGTPQAGVMFRASTSPTDAFAALMQTTGNQLLFEYRSGSGGSVSSTSVGSVPVGAEYLEIVRTGSSFRAFYSANGSSWTQLGSSVAIAAIPSTALAGLAVTANYNAQLAAAVFSNVQILAAPVATNASASTNPVTGTSTGLSVTGSDAAGAALTYTWSTTSLPANAPTPTFTGSGSSVTARFYAAGPYTFTVTVADPYNQTATATVNVTVNQTAGTITVTPAGLTLASTTSQTYSASAVDQFGNAITSFTFGASGGGYMNTASGAFTANQSGGTYTITASGGSNTGSTTVNVVPTIYTDLSGNHTYAVNLNSSTPTQLQIFVDTPETASPTYTIPLLQMPSLGFNLGSGSDTVTVDFTSGNPIPAGGLNLGASGTDTLNVTGGSSINAVSLSALALGANASLAVLTPTNHGNRAVLVTNSLTVPSTSLLDLGGNDMIVAGGDLGGISNQIFSGSNGGTWNGTTGITSSAAATTPGTALGVEQNTDGTSPLLSSFDGQAVTTADVLIKYTYLGDADLSGSVTGSDYTLVDTGYNNHYTGWHNGDFNYDGVINGNDYTLIDNAYNTQSTPLAQIAPTSNSELLVTAEPAAQIVIPPQRKATVFVVAATPWQTNGTPIIWNPVPATSAGDILDQLDNRQPESGY